MVQTDISSIVYVGNVSTTAAYPVPFNFFRDEDLVVIVKDAANVEETQLLNTDYTVAGEGDPNGGAVTFTWAVPATSFVTILRDIDATQLTSYEEADAFPAKSHERALDKLTMLCQQNARVAGGTDPSSLGLAFRLTESSVGINAVAKVNGTTLGLDVNGNAILRTAEEMLDFMGEAGTAWLNTAERINTRGAFAGQVGVQIDNQTVYIAQSSDPGDWLPFLPGSGIVFATDGTPEMHVAPAGDLVGTTEPQVLTNKTFEDVTISGVNGLTPADVGLDQVNNTSDVNKPVSAPTNAALSTKQPYAEKGFANGYASLDATGKVPAAQLPASTGGVSSVNGETGVVTIDKADVGLGSCDNTSDLAKPVSTATQTALNLKQSLSEKTVANGYPSLDGSGKIPLAQIPDAVVGASQYQGTWNAATNTPTIPAAAVGNKGWYYSVAVAGTTNINGINSWAVGDQIISNGTVWQKIANVQAVSSVAGKTGAVTLVPADVSLGNVDNTSDANKPVSTAQAAADALKEDKANKGIASGYASLDASGKVPTAQLPTAPVTTVNSRTGDVVVNKTDVGLSACDNTSDATKNSATATLTNKTIAGSANTLTVRLANDVTGNLPVGNLNNGTGASGTTAWFGDGTWKTPTGTGDVNGPAGSADGELLVASGTTGKILRRYSGGTGFAKVQNNAAVTPQALIQGSDLDPSTVHGQTQKSSALLDADEFLVWDSSVSALRRVAAPLVRHLPGEVVQTIYAEVRSEIVAADEIGPPFVSTQGTQILSAAITPVYANSKILVTSNGNYTHHTTPATTIDAFFMAFVSGTSATIGTRIIAGYGAGLQTAWALEFMYTPGSGAKTYSIRVASNITSSTVSLTINGSGYTTPTAYSPVCALVLQEIKQ